MKNNMEDIDKLIKETLNEEEAKFYDKLEEQNLLEQVGGLFQGKIKWILILMNIVNLVVVALFFYCLVQFLNTESTNQLIKWASAGFVCLIFAGMIKLFVWLQMDKNALLREIKRLELQVSSLSGRISE
ncbi:DUF6768 family protein [Cognatitamlana onchidii]|uniref:DUF6768 family protein n=1 Tax=Cognatitamlana onchidii TaxID=2562860 RepID=UPI0010A64208|nr:DUF6768 family protein [Algibacter onchidii]